MLNIYKLFSHFLGILFFKKKPQELEYSKSTFFTFIGLITLVSYANILILGINIPNIKIFMFLSILVNNCTFFLILYAFLLKNGIRNRFVQISTNLLGIEIINCLFFLSFIFINNKIYNDYIPFLLSLLISTWLFVVRINIIRYSFNYGIIFSLILLLLFFFISLIFSMISTFLLSFVFHLL